MDGTSLTLLGLYFVIGSFCGFIANVSLLKGNHSAPNLVHFHIGMIGGAVTLFWPVAILVYVIFFVAKRSAHAVRSRLARR